MSKHIKTISDGVLRRIAFEGRALEVWDRTQQKWVKSAETVPAFIKPGEEPKKAIQRLMTSIKPKAPKREFPRFCPQMTIADYVAQFERNNNLRQTCTKHLDGKLFTFPEGDDCVIESI